MTPRKWFIDSTDLNDKGPIVASSSLFGGSLAVYVFTEEELKEFAKEFFNAAQFKHFVHDTIEAGSMVLKYRHWSEYWQQKFGGK